MLVKTFNSMSLVSVSMHYSVVCTHEYTPLILLRIIGGAVVHSYGRLIFHERVITDRRQLQPPNNDTGDGRIECIVSSGQARFNYRGYNVPNADSQKATAVIQVGSRNFVNIEGDCDGIYHYLFLSNGEIII